MKQKTAVIALLGNANYDSRIVNLTESLNKLNVDVTTISFEWKNKNFKTQIGKTYIYKLDKSYSSFIYYFNFFFLLTKTLLKHKADIYFAEDIQTLPIVYFFAKLNKAKIYYNSREIYAHLGGLRNKSFVQTIIAKVENIFIRKVNYVLVTGEMDASFLRDAYSINNFIVLRNLPKYQDVFSSIDLRAKLNISNEEKILIYQGVLLEGRGITRIINILHNLPSTHFVILGEGEYRKEFETIASKSKAANRIHFLGAVNNSELLNYTTDADIGIALIENISISYYYALPNKLFEYIMAGVPILSSNLPQMKKIIDIYSVGKYVDPDYEDDIISVLNEMLNNDKNLAEFKSNCRYAAKELNWEAEFNKIKEILLN